MDPFKKQPHEATTQPVVQGTSVIAVKYADGVMMLADTLASFGSLSRYTDVRRIRGINKNTMLGGGGEFADFQWICDKLLDELTVEDYVEDDGNVLSAKEIHSFLTRVCYNRRSKMDPLWNALVVGGFEGDEVFLGQVDLYGSSYTGDIAATGYGLYLAKPLLRKHYKPNMSEAEARALLEDCMKVLFYRDCRTVNKFTLAKITKQGTKVSEPYSLDTQWTYKRFTDPHDHQL
jgi:20S proteasome subunit beta 7